ARVEAVGDRPDLPLVGHARLHRVGVILPVGPALEVVVERGDVAGIRQLADAVAADVDDVGGVARVERQQELGVVVAAGDLLQVDLHRRARVGGLDGGAGLVDVGRLLAELVGVGDGDRAGQLGPAARRAGRARGG